jgi:hypothetical protein
MCVCNGACPPFLIDTAPHTVHAASLTLPLLAFGFDLSAMFQWCYSGVPMVLQYDSNGVTVVFKWCSSGVAVVLRRRALHNKTTVVLIWVLSLCQCLITL